MSKFSQQVQAAFHPYEQPDDTAAQMIAENLACSGHSMADFSRAVRAGAPVCAMPPVSRPSVHRPPQAVIMTKQSGVVCQAPVDVTPGDMDVGHHMRIMGFWLN